MSGAILELEGATSGVTSVEPQDGKSLVITLPGATGTLAVPQYSKALTPVPDGTTRVFTTPGNFATGSTRPFIGGLRQILGTHYTETAANQITYVLGAQPHTGGNHAIDYDAA
jgi:hypothetical protein